jgi:hypothetical protein
VHGILAGWRRELQGDATVAAQPAPTTVEPAELVAQP